MVSASESMESKGCLRRGIQVKPVPKTNVAEIGAAES